MNQQDNQSILIEGVSEIALEDMRVQNADAIKGGPASRDNAGETSSSSTLLIASTNPGSKRNTSAQG